MNYIRKNTEVECIW